MNSLVELIRTASRPLLPIATEVRSDCPPLPGIRAVLFDVYGTLVISGSGDVGTVSAARGTAFAEACQAVGLKLNCPGDVGAEKLTECVQASHAADREQGIEFPEVEIIEIWRRTLESLADQLVGSLADQELGRLALEYELRVNPVWPMPGSRQLLADLQNSDLKLGIVSNAQFFTPLLFAALLEDSVAELGFSPELCFFSYAYQQAKPGRHLFELARQSLESLAIAPGEILYIGNDMLNDVMPAQQVGFRTALFAGDRRSLRQREDDPRVADTRPDAVVTQLAQLTTLLNLNQ